MYHITVGVRLPAQTRQKVVKYSSALSISQSSFIRILIKLALDLVERNPEILLDRNNSVESSGK
jgi:hypothetical protein